MILPSWTGDRVFAPYGVLRAYVEYFNTLRPHQGLNQRIPQATSPSVVSPPGGSVLVQPILGGLHHAYAWAA